MSARVRLLKSPQKIVYLFFRKATCELAKMLLSVGFFNFGASAQPSALFARGRRGLAEPIALASAMANSIMIYTTI